MLLEQGTRCMGSTGWGSSSRGSVRTPKLHTHGAPAGRQPCQPQPGHRLLNQRAHSRCDGVRATACQTPGSPLPVCREESTVINVRVAGECPVFPKFIRQENSMECMQFNAWIKAGSKTSSQVNELLQVIKITLMFRLRFYNKIKILS